MDFAKAKLLNDPIVENAFNILQSFLPLTKSQSQEALKVAQILSAECTKKDPELIAAALLRPFADPNPTFIKIASATVTGSEPTQRTLDILSQCLETTMHTVSVTISGGKTVHRTQEIKEPQANPSLAAENNLLYLADITAELEELNTNKISFLVVKFARACGDDEADQILKEGVESLRETALKARRILGATGEAKLEQRFVKAYNRAAKALNEPLIASPSSKPPSPPKSPTP